MEFDIVVVVVDYGVLDIDQSTGPDSQVVGDIVVAVVVVDKTKPDIEAVVAAVADKAPGIDPAEWVAYRVGANVVPEPRWMVVDRVAEAAGVDIGIGFVLEPEPEPVLGIEVVGNIVLVLDIAARTIKFQRSHNCRKMHFVQNFV